MNKVHTERSNWKGREYINELYLFDIDSVDLSNKQPITQTQAVCFTKQGDIVIYKHRDGWYGLPGGKIEEGELFDKALEREIYEEVSCKCLYLLCIGFNKSWEILNPQNITYNLRYLAIVDILDESINDPAGKSVERLILNIQEAKSILNWGEKGNILIDHAKKAFDYFSSSTIN